MSANYNEFSKLATDNSKEMFSEFGLDLTKLVIENISFPEEVEKAIDARSSIGVMGQNMDYFVK